MPESPTTAKCPSCASPKVWKDGIRSTSYGDVQRYVCRDCGYRFTVNNGHKGFKPIRESSTCGQIGAPQTKGAKNLVIVEPPQEDGLAGATEIDSDSKGKIVEFIWKLKRDGYKDSTIQRYRQGLITLIKDGADIFDPESVKEIIARQNWQEGTKLNYVNYYDAFARFAGIKWDRPRYTAEEKMPFIPLESEIDLLIHGAPKKMSVALQVMKEIAARIGETLGIMWSDVDAERNIVRINSVEKRSKSGTYKVSTQLIQRILCLPRDSEFVFGKGRMGMKSYFSAVRKRLAREHQNPRLLNITFHTIRHWKATTEYHKTKDLLYVKEFLRHRSIDNTMIYIHLEKVVFGESPNDEYHVRVARNLDEACELLEAGFDYVCEVDGKSIFRKRK